MSRTFTITAERVRSGWWVTECAEAGCVSQVRRLDQVADDLREAIAYQAGLPSGGFDLVVVPVLPVEYQEAVAEAESARKAEAEARNRAARASRRAVRSLRDAGLSVRDIGTVMGVSHQRAAQLAEG